MYVPFSSSFIWLGRHGSCSFSWCVFVWLFILFRLLCLGWSVVPFYCGGFSQWVGLDDWLVKVSRLGKLALVFWCMELDFLSLECNGVSSSEFWDGSMCVGSLVWLWAACMLTLRAMFLSCWRICMVCLALELIGPWVVVGFHVGLEAFGWSLVN